MKDMEQPNMENLINKEGVVDEKLYNDNNQSVTAKSNRPTERVDAEINSNIGSVSFGKFKDADSLLKAYNSLQAEFTKKSQKLSELEEGLKPLTKQEQINTTIEGVSNKYSVAEPLKQKLREALAQTDSDDYEKLAEQNLIKILVNNSKTPEEMVGSKEFLSNYIFNNVEIKDAIIKEYLTKLKSAPNVKVATSFNSSIPATPPNIVKSISEAGSIARSIIKIK